MDNTDTEQGETATTKDWHPEGNTAGSSPFPAEQNGGESFASSKDEEANDPLSECPDSVTPHSLTPQSSPASRPQLSPAGRETPAGINLVKKHQVRGISFIPYA